MNKKAFLSQTPIPLEGKTLKSLILEKISQRISHITAHYPTFKPQLAILLLGDDPSSLTYVNQKKLAAESIGITAHIFNYPTSISLEVLLSEIQKLNTQTSIHGILIQLPLPPHLSLGQVVQAIDPEKDVDGVHPLNTGRLLNEQSPSFIPATPLGILKLLSHYHIPIDGQNVTILNRSTIVGKPLACLLGSKNSYGNATVTLCHQHTRNIQEHIAMADILITATSIPHFLNEKMLKPGSVVVDLGQSVQVRDGKRYITGDVNINPQKSHISAFTPVPGGVGPMTVACLMENIFKSCVKYENIPSDVVDYDFF